MARCPRPGPAPLLLLLGSLLTLRSALLQGVGIPGGLSPISPTGRGVQKAATAAAEKFNEDSNDANYFKMLFVVKAEVQVVSGLKYYFTVVLAKTECEKRMGEKKVYRQIENCALPPRDQQEKRTCDFQVWSRPWMNVTEVTSMSCS